MSACWGQPGEFLIWASQETERKRLMNERAWFNWQDGIRFQRQANGDVVFEMDERLALSDGTRIAARGTIPADEWVSIITVMSADGGSPTAHTAARLLHLGVDVHV